MLKSKMAYYWWTILILSCLGVTGCLLSGTFVIDLSLNEMAFTTATFHKQQINLSSNQTYNDHKDQIKDITDIGFALKIENNSALTASGELYLSDESTYTTASQVKSNATLILTGISVPANSTKSINWSESYQYIRNLGALKEQVKSGSFRVYALIDSAPLNLRIYDASLIITFAAVP